MVTHNDFHVVVFSFRYYSILCLYFCYFYLSVAAVCTGKVMDFQRLLLRAANDLRNDDVRALVFLCTELLRPSRSDSVDTASDLFSILADQNHLTPERPHLLTELLLIIQQNSLIRDLKLQMPLTARLIPPFRKLLYDLSVDITNEDLKGMKFLLREKIPRRKLEQSSTLEVFLEMEHLDLLSDTNLNLLEEIITSVCPVLKEKIIKFKEDHVNCSFPVPDEMQPLRSKSSSFEQNQVSQSSEPRIRSLSELPSSVEGRAYREIVSVGGVLDDDENLSRGLRAMTTEESSRVDTILTREDGHSSFDTEDPTNTSDEDVKTYSMNGVKRGICLIINNIDFKEVETKLKQREGTIIDEARLKKVFEWLGFEVNIERNCNKEKIISSIQELSTRDHSQMDCLVCCVLSHGAHESVYGVDGRTVQLTELMQPLNGLHCPSLNGKPKLFFIQACQGSAKQTPVYFQSDGPTDTNLSYDAAPVKRSIPADADFLLAVASIPLYVSCRNKKFGTWFIQSLCKNLTTMVPRNYDLMDIMTKVNNDVSQQTAWLESRFLKQMPRCDSRLRKKVVFPVPIEHPERL
ncbi:caspase-8 isoform X2 [Phycodurus eques]|uniref:caspase-8 isoform X2 n=1 Tax=Phycodurus eques TaxID=693459 RepID=UPI002ACD6371|nr:caspase-8 isoform X2 [Phycodurus eques]